MSDLLIGYPTGWTLSVIDDAGRASDAADTLRALGLPDDAVIVISGADAAQQLRRLGASSGALARLRRSIQFMTMDQLPDLFVYEAAVKAGHPVVAVRIPAALRAEVLEILRRHGAHFINSFGAWATSEIEPWRGAKPPIPQHMHR